MTNGHLGLRLVLLWVPQLRALFLLQLWRQQWVALCPPVGRQADHGRNVGPSGALSARGHRSRAGSGGAQLPAPEPWALPCISRVSSLDGLSFSPSKPISGIGYW